MKLTRSSPGVGTTGRRLGRLARSKTRSNRRGELPRPAAPC